VEFQLRCVAAMDLTVEILRDHWTLRRIMSKDAKA
jgi:hypothetical protein